MRHVVLALSLAGAVTVAATSPWTEVLVEPAAWSTTDFQILYAAGSAHAAGDDPYDPSVLDRFGRPTGRPTTPFCAAQPLVVAAFGVLATRPFDAAYRAWRTACVVLAVLSAALLVAAARTAGCPWTVAGAVVVSALGLGDGTWMALAMNSTNVVALLALAAALVAGQRERRLAEGLALSLAVVAKTSPAIVVVAAALAGRWRTVAGAALGLIALTLLGVGWAGWELHADWVQRVLPALGYAPDLPPGRFDNGLHAWNMAPHGVLARAAEQAGWPRALVHWGAWGITALVVVQWAAAVRGTSPGRAGEPLGAVLGDPRDRATTARARQLLGAYGAAIAASWLVSSVTWPHHLMLVVFPAAALSAWAAREGARASAAVGAAAIVVLWLPLGTFADDPGQSIDVPLKTAAAVVLFAVCTRRLDPAEALGSPSGTAAAS